MKKIILLILILSLCGCNYKELDKIAITLGCGIEKIDNEYQITIQIADTQKQGNSNTSSSSIKFKNYSNKDKTIHEAFRGVLSKLPKKVYSGHLQVLIIDESIAHSGLEDIMDFFFREVELRNDFYVFVSRNNTPSEILNVLTQVYPINSIGIRNLLENNNKYLSGSILSSFENLIDEYISPTKEIILPSITVIGKNGDKKENLETSNPNSLLLVNETSIFKDNKLIFYLDKNQTIYYNLIKNKLKNTIINVECSKDKYITLEIINNKTDIKINKNTPIIDINIKSKVNLTSSMCNYDISINKGIKQIEYLTSLEIEKNINDLINLSKEYKTDIFYFKDLYYKKNNKYYNKITDYENFYQNLKVNLSVNVNIFEKGNSLKVIDNEKNK